MDRDTIKAKMASLDASKLEKIRSLQKSMDERRNSPERKRRREIRNRRIEAMRKMGMSEEGISMRM